jgi:hypothetical protein
MKCKLIIAVVCMITCTAALNAQVFEKSKSETRSFPATKGCTVNISNKYGSIQVIPIDVDSVKFLVEVKVTNKKEEDAEKKLDAVSVNFTSNPYLITASTLFRDAPGQWASDLNDLAKSVFNPTNKVEINYFVYLPPSVNLKIDNKYGNIFVADHTGQVDISLSNGDLKAGNISNDASFRFSFVNASVTSVVNLAADMNYTELTIKKINNARITSKSSKFWISSVTKLDLDSRSDKFAIDTVASINGKTSFSGVTAGVLKDGMLLSSMYGDLNLSEVLPTVKFINLTAEYTDIIVILRNDVSCKFFADYRKTKINYTPGIGDLTTTVTDAEKQQATLTGLIGQDANTPSSVQISAMSGSLSLLKR